MLNKLKARWRELRKSEPGHRFQENFERRHKQNGGKLNLSKLLHIGAGLALIFAGLFLLAVPGPGLLVIAVGLGLLGGEFLVLARFLDWAEVRLRKWMHAIAGFWRRRSLPIKILIVLVIAAVLLAGCYALYAWFWQNR